MLGIMVTSAVVIVYGIILWKATHPKEDTTNGIQWQVHGYINY